MLKGSWSSTAALTAGHVYCCTGSTNCASHCSLCFVWWDLSSEYRNLQLRHFSSCGILAAAADDSCSATAGHLTSWETRRQDSQDSYRYRLPYSSWGVWLWLATLEHSTIARLISRAALRCSWRWVCWKCSCGCAGVVPVLIATGVHTVQPWHGAAAFCFCSRRVCFRWQHTRTMHLQVCRFVGRQARQKPGWQFCRCLLTQCKLRPDVFYHVACSAYKPTTDAASLEARIVDNVRTLVVFGMRTS